MDRLVQKAFDDWVRSGGQEQPANMSEVVSYQGKQYVILENCRGVLAVYRVTRRVAAYGE